MRTSLSQFYMNMFLVECCRSSQFIMSMSKYFEGGNHGIGVGMISRMQIESEDYCHVRR